MFLHLVELLLSERICLKSERDGFTKLKECSGSNQKNRTSPSSPNKKRLDG